MGGAVLELFAKLGMDTSEYDKGLEDAKGKGNKFASFLGGIGKAGAAAFTAVGAATVAMGKQAVDAYANYEQLWGGVQKLYGEAAETVKENAEKAYMTTNMSMNEYMQTATQFSAALTKSLNGDVQESARITDIAMRAISDNINTFGSDAEFVTNAFMGLSRENYTMIDNLKLGYAGTKQGMLELINDSGVLGYTLTNTSQLAEVGFANMVLAIEEVQKQQHVAGTTAEEAMFTIEGSAKATKSAWENVITAIGKGEGLSSALDDLTTAVFGNGEKGSGFLANIIPRIQKTMESIGEFAVQAGPLLAEKIPEVLSAIVPAVFETITQLTASMSQFIFEKLPEFLAMGVEMINSLAEGLAEGIPALLETALPTLLSFAESLRENMGLIVDAGLNLIVNLAQGLVNALPNLIRYVPLIVTNIAGIINDNMPKIFKTAVEIIVMLGKGIIDSIPIIIENFGNIVEAIFSVIQAVNWLALGSKVVKLIADGVKALFNLPIDIFKNIGKNIVETFRGGFKWADLGKGIIDGIVSGIKNFGGAIKDSLMGMVKSAWNGVKSFFGIRSPSKLMRDTVGKWIPLGIAEGIEDAADSVYNEMEDLGDGTVDAYNTDFDDIFSTKVSGKPDAGTINYGGLTFNIYGAEGQSPEEIAMAVRDIIVDEEERNNVVYA